MHTDFLIVGQGICGTWLSYFLQQHQQQVVVIDNGAPRSASRVAAGIINPVTGRRLVKTWMIDELLPSIENWYAAFGREICQPVIHQKSMIDFFPTPQMMLAFRERQIAAENRYLHNASPGPYQAFFNFDFDCGEIAPVYMVQLDIMLRSWRQSLRDKKILLEEEFDIRQLQAGKQVKYKDITASHIIFCDGTGSFYQNPFFHLLPFAPNKGEALLVQIPGLPATHIYKKGIMLAPLAQDALFWAGSNYLWDFKDALPSPLFYQKTAATLKEWLKMPFTIVDHQAAIRPATLERRPFVGFHPLHTHVGILNGMGTKGCSLAPFFAHALVQHILFGKAIHPEGDIRRFERILSKNG